MKAIKLSFILILTAALNPYTIAQNVQISGSGNPNEPSIMMDPKNPDILVAGSNLNFYYTSDNGGLTWTVNKLTSPYGVWGDPVIDIDTSGNFYFFHLSNTPGGNWVDRIVCQKSSDNGNTWSSGTYTGLNGSKMQDKQWSVIDRNNNNIYLTWTEFDNYKSISPTDSSRILFSKSLDQGITWTSPTRINKISGDCMDKDNTVEGAVPAVGPSGQLYVSWAGPDGIVFNRSLDEGATWLPAEILVDPMPGGWDIAIPGLDRANGLPITKCDLSSGPNKGTIYINWTDQRNGTDNTDVWLCKSIDGGNTWTSPVKVNDDASGKHQFFTWMDIDQTNGNLYFVFYDRRAYTDNRTDVYMAVSTDGGVSFINKKISSTPFTPTNGIFFGDYTNIVAHNDIVRAIWTRLDGGQLSIWTDVTPLSKLLSIPESSIEVLSNEAKVFPNPATHINYVSFKLHERATIKLELFDQNGRWIATLINNAEMEYGKHILPVNTDELGLSTGTYYYKLAINGKSETLRTIFIE